MPLKRGSSNTVVQENTTRLIREGVPVKQAVARAHTKARRYPNRTTG